ncbi:hypothetical protein AX16_005887 [Volvariella volvacea WC 439]|nr:hypothetical protein AX16_005887 [Volvariella volvacea WC 439]
MSLIQEMFIQLLWEFLHRTRLSRLLVLSQVHKRRAGHLSTSGWADADLLKSYRTGHRVDHDPDKDASRPVALVSPDTIMKMGSELEAFSTEFVSSRTSIPLPICERVIKNDDDVEYLVMEYIPGRTLSSCWEELGWWTKFRVLVTLRDYVGQLRALKHTVPGPIGRDGRPQICYGPLFGEEAGPFEDRTALAAFYNHKLDVMKEYKPRLVARLTEPFDNSGPLVYTHLDLHMRNMMLGDDGQLWLIDWDFAGFYPIWFEYAGMKVFEDRQPSSFNKWIPLITGRWEGPGQWPFVSRVGWALLVGKNL